MRKRISKIFYDKRDHELIDLVNDALDKRESKIISKKRYFPYLHPHGIKEMAESRGLRIAYAVAHLLDSIEDGKVDERLMALRSLRDEVLFSPESMLQKNTARVLIQIMKDLVRARGNYPLQLKLAHDFRVAASGKPRFIRQLLKRYYLLEMSEDWNQVAFDDHVHDANTKGRKNSTHLIMDAWIKGIRRLRVIYYNWIQPKFAAELLEAAQIMGIDVRIGIEFNAPFYDKYIQFIWVARGFSDFQDFLCFLAEDSVKTLMEEGKKVSQYQEQQVIDTLHAFNRTHREKINNMFELDLEPIDPDAFMASVGSGQASLIHLSDFIHTKLLARMKKKLTQLQQTYLTATPEERQTIEETVDQMNQIDATQLLESCLSPSQNPDVRDPARVLHSDDVPLLLRQSPSELIERVVKLRSGYRITLNLSNLHVEDVLELLYDANGRVTRLEIFNLKDYSEGKVDHIPYINELQQAINQSNMIHLKKIIRGIITRMETTDNRNAERIAKLRAILHDIYSLKSMYQGNYLISRIGSDSTGRSPRVPGMGLVIRETLPFRAQKEIKKMAGSQRFALPIHMDALFRKNYVPECEGHHWTDKLRRHLSRVSWLSFLGYKVKPEWLALENSTRITPEGNIITLGGRHYTFTNNLSLDQKPPEPDKKILGAKYFNTHLKNFLKVFIGFVPAFFSFALMYDWWVLAYLGAFIWFGITGFRNIIQSVLGGGGFHRSHLLRWNDYVSWDRLTDSLLFTGFSVPLLDFLTKNLFLKQTLGITTATHPMFLYTFMAFVNGIYLFSHNMFRGLPKEAAIGNFFRSVLSIPIAIFFNTVIGSVLSIAGVAGVDAILQKWAAVISKSASDCVAGVIEGTADRAHNMRMRVRDYQSKFDQLFDTYAQLELLFPETQVLEIVRNPAKFLKSNNAEAQDLKKMIIINALDLLHFWMYQPRSRNVFKLLVKDMTDEEKEILFQTQFILMRQRQISLLFIDGLVGKNFSRGLAFYLARSSEYLKGIKKIALTQKLDCTLPDVR